MRSVRVGLLSIVAFALGLSPIVYAAETVVEENVGQQIVSTTETVEPPISPQVPETPSVIQNTETPTPPLVPNTAPPSVAVLEPPIATISAAPMVVNEPQPAPMPKLVFSKVSVGDNATNEYVEIINIGTQPASLQNVQVQYLTASFAANDPALKPTRVLKAFGTNEVLQPGETYILVHKNAGITNDGGKFGIFDDTTATGSLAKTGGSVRLAQSVPTPVLIDTVGWGTAKQFEGAAAPSDSTTPLQRCYGTTVVDTDNNKNDLQLYDEAILRVLPLCVVAPPEPVVNECKGLVLSEIGANLESDAQFIEIENPTAAAIDLTGCRAQTNRSSTAYYSLPNQSLTPGTMYVLKIQGSGLTLTKTSSGTVYVLSSDGKTEVDSQDYSNLAEQTSLAFFGDSWQQTYAVTPGEKNIYQQFASCAVGYERNVLSGRCVQTAGKGSVLLADCGEGKYRSEETNRCRSYATIAGLTPCKDGQYRSEETNRCRSIAATAAAVLKPCNDDQFRNPATGRCKKIASTEDILKPCAEGYVRNPTTNRCKKAAIAALPAADFKPTETAGSIAAKTSWWVVLLLLLAAAGYGVFEWRREIVRIIKRIVATIKP